jgi:hypothetical protein
MDKIYISFWSGGQKHVRYNMENDLFFLKNFIRLFSKYNPTLKLILICDTSTKQKLPSEITEMVEIKQTSDKYNAYPPQLWPMVKVLTIADIEEEEVLHLDFDIVWKYDIQYLFTYIRQNKIDALYQSYESLGISHRYYSDFLKKNAGAMSLLLKARMKSAYNAGICYFSKAAKSQLKAIVAKYKSDCTTFGDNVSLEQMIIPNELIQQGFNVQTLSEILMNLPFSENNRKFPEAIGEFDNPLFTSLNSTGTFINSISYFHFLGTVKKKDGLKEAVNYLSAD